jgi:hypothetical protein
VLGFADYQGQTVETPRPPPGATRQRSASSQVSELVPTVETVSLRTRGDGRSGRGADRRPDQRLGQPDADRGSSPDPRIEILMAALEKGWYVAVMLVNTFVSYATFASEDSRWSSAGLTGGRCASQRGLRAVGPPANPAVIDQGLGTAAGTYAQVRRFGDRRLRLPGLLVRVDGCPVEEKHAHPAALGLIAIDSTSLPA